MTNDNPTFIAISTSEVQVGDKVMLDPSEGPIVTIDRIKGPDSDGYFVFWYDGDDGSHGIGPARIIGLVERPLPTSATWYDRRETLAARLELGVSGLRDIIRARREAGYERKERLEEWCLLGFLWFDTCGNCMRITKGAPADSLDFIDVELARHIKFRIPDVLSRAEVDTFSKSWTATMFFFQPADAVCDRCSRGWATLGNSLRDHYSFWQDDAYIHRHESCQKLWVIQRDAEGLRKIVDDAKIEVMSTALIPSQYHDDATYFGPWMVVTTPKGKFTLGWRKRVISIEWEKMDFDVPASLFAAEDEKNITHWETGIHAYGSEHAVDILRRMWFCAPSPDATLADARREHAEFLRKQDEHGETDDEGAS